MREIYEKMREHVERLEDSKIRGLSTRDVVAQSYTDADFIKLVNNLENRPLSPDTSFRLSSFIFEGQSKRISEDLRRKAADNVADHVSKLDVDVDFAAVEIFVFWGSHRPDYRSVCSRILDHARPDIRRIALLCAGFFLPRRDYDELLRFHQDQYISEIAMCGPLRFVLRDQALDVLKSLTECDIVEDDCFEQRPEGPVFYRSWSPFLLWFEKHKVR